MQFDASVAALGDQLRHTEASNGTDLGLRTGAHTAADRVSQGGEAKSRASCRTARKICCALAP
jgi:hypothetical protein